MKRQNISIVPLHASKEVLFLAESALSVHGFKWRYRGGTDLCKGDIDVTIAGDTLTVSYKQHKTGVFGKGSVFSKSVGKVSKIEIPRDPVAIIAMVHVKEPVKHFDWEGKEVTEA